MIFEATGVLPLPCSNVTVAPFWIPVPTMVTVIGWPPAVMLDGLMLVTSIVGADGGVDVEVGDGPMVGVDVWVGVDVDVKVTTGVDVGVGVADVEPPTAAKALIRPKVVKLVVEVPVPAILSAVLSIRLRTQALSCAPHRPLDHTRPARPDTWGVAMDVPLMVP